MGRATSYRLWDRFCLRASRALGGRTVFKHSVQMEPKPRRDGRLDLFPGVPERHLSRCFACGTSWKWARGHETPYSDSSACFPLCEQCWAAMTPDERLPYYSRLVAEWVAQSGPLSGEKWPAIQAAVLEGK